MYAGDILSSLRDLGGVLEVLDLPVSCSDPRGRSLTTKLLSTPRAPWLSLWEGLRHTISTGLLPMGDSDVTDLPLIDCDLGGQVSYMTCVVSSSVGGGARGRGLARSPQS